MRQKSLWRAFWKWLLGRHGNLKSFGDEVKQAGGVAGRSRAGQQVVPIEKIVGSVDRAKAMRSDFFYRSGRAVTARFERIGEAMKQGKQLPPIELYKLKVRRQGREAPPASEYYVVDGHHRVAMARKLGQEYIDANVEAYRVAGPHPDEADTAGAASPTEAPPDATGEPAGGDAPGTPQRDSR
jgi:hypothetical protein